MSKKSSVHPIIEQMLADKVRTEKQLRAGKPLLDIGIKIVSPISVPAKSAK